MTQVIDKAHLAAVVTGTDRERIAAFLRDDATAFAPNGFPTTTAGAARHIWRGHAFEFPILGVATAGLSCLMEALTRLPIGEPLTRHYLKSPQHICTVFLNVEGAFVGAVLYGKPNVPLPDGPVSVAVSRPTSEADPAQQRRRRPQQLDLFG
ncbi:hypothetical protein ACQKJ1_23805 [Methylorubrum rhodesianum]|jgi:hypothetical protein|uniref:hypothetical protein n=1 Tax=Methylobacteriaceae TaxID=119045 RepID=UPI001F12DF09|nr:hypothetical protein [Methylobacterium organophilum]UMY20297.1 hypothetical protein MMB17_24985 [Methylobacterium organophilum]HSI10934.1 hypothetical protein [Chthoniobacter sp.]